MPCARRQLFSWGLAALAALIALVLLWPGPEGPGGPSLDLEAPTPGTPRFESRPGSPGPLAAGAARPSGPARREAPPPTRSLPVSADMLSGEVVDPDGNPIARASLRLVSWSSPSPAPASARAMSDDSGTFRFQGLFEGTWGLSSWKEGWASVAGLEVEVPAEAPLRVVMVPDRPARLRVVDGDGLPLSRARIEARVEGAAASFRPVLPPGAVRSTTGPDGWAELKGLPGDDSAAIEITAGHPGRPPVRLVKKAGELRSGELSIVMPAGATLWGLVVGPPGEPEANVRLILAPAHPDPREPLSPPRTLHSTSAGAFRFTGLPGGEYFLHADGGERGRRKIEGLKLEGEAGREVRVELALPGSKEFEEAVPRAPAAVVRPLKSGGAPGTGTIRGRLRTDSPPPRFAIGLVPHGSGGPPERVYQQSARRAEFSLLSVPAGTYEVLLLVDGKVHSRAEGVTVEAGREAGPVELRLE